MEARARPSLRIAITGNFGLTGKQTMAARALPMAQALAARAHAVCMALPIREGADEDVRRVDAGVALRYSGRGPLHGLAYLRQALSMALTCWRWRPDVVYCFKPIAHSWVVLTIFWLLRRIGLFGGAIALDTDDWEGRGGWNEKQAFPGWLKAFIAWQERWSLRKADVVTVASKALAELVVQEVSGRNVVYVPNALAAVPDPMDGVGPDLRARLGVGSGQVVLLYTRFVEFEPRRVLDTLEKILQELGDAELLVVGKGLVGEEQGLLREAAERGLQEKVVAVGWPPPEPLRAYFAAADIALYPMDDTLLNRTKCPVKLLELMGAGLPVVADRVGQAAEYLEDGRTGRLVPSDNFAAMSEAAVELLRSPEGRRTLGRAARLDVCSRWTWQAWAPVVEKALEEVLRVG